MILRGALVWTLTLTACAMASEEWARGELAMSSEDWSRAAEHFRRYRENHPDVYQGWLQEGHSLWRAGDREGATSRFERVLELEPEQPDALVHLAKQAYDLGDFKHATELLDRLEPVPLRLTRYHDHLLGASLVRGALDPERAATLLDRTGVGNDADRILLALAHIRRGALQDAIPLIDAVWFPSVGELRTEAWIRRLDRDNCGDLLDEELEVLRALLADEWTYLDEGVRAAVVHVYTRNGRDVDDLRERPRVPR